MRCKPQFVGWIVICCLAGCGSSSVPVQQTVPKYGSAQDGLAYPIVPIPDDLPSTQTVETKYGELLFVLPRMEYLSHHFWGWQLCIDRARFAPTLADIEEWDPPLASFADIGSVRGFEDGFHSCKQRLIQLREQFSDAAIIAACKLTYRRWPPDVSSLEDKK